MTRPCPDCGVAPGDHHLDGCDVERCPLCGHQFLSCSCRSNDGGQPWSGVWPGVEDCQRLGFYAILVPGLGWVPCDKNEPGATENLNMLNGVNAVWHRDTQRWEPPGGTDDDVKT